MTADPSIPQQRLLYESTRDVYGDRLALVFGNEFNGGECPFYTVRQCHHCDIGAGEGVQFTPPMNKGRLEFFKEYYPQVLSRVAHVLVYNSGSVLNPREMSPETLDHILEYLTSLGNCHVISVDSRERYITTQNLDRLIQGIRPDQTPRVVFGIETQDDSIRIENLKKRMTRGSIERVFKIAGTYHGRIGIDINVVFQPPEIVGEDAIREAVATTEYGLTLGERYGVPVDFNLNPYYPSQRSRTRFPHHPRANMGHSLEALARMMELVTVRGAASIVYLGWHDEGHDQAQDARTNEKNMHHDVVGEFNVTQDVTILRT